jgi:hypothetical protein
LRTRKDAVKFDLSESLLCFGFAFRFLEARTEVSSSSTLDERVLSSTWGSTEANNRGWSLRQLTTGGDDIVLVLLSPRLDLLLPTEPGVAGRLLDDIDDSSSVSSDGTESEDDVLRNTSSLFELKGSNPEPSSSLSSSSGGVKSRSKALLLSSTAISRSRSSATTESDPDNLVGIAARLLLLAGIVVLDNIAAMAGEIWAGLEVAGALMLLFGPLGSVFLFLSPSENDVLGDFGGITTGLDMARSDLDVGGAELCLDIGGTTFSFNMAFFFFSRRFLSDSKFSVAATVYATENDREARIILAVDREATQVALGKSWLGQRKAG